MKALTLFQPWAWLIITPDPDRPNFPLKDVENRSWSLPASFKIPQRIYVHASLRYDSLHFEDRGVFVAGSDIIIPSKDELAYGAIIGEVTIMGATQCSKSDWADGNGYWAFDLKYPTAYETAIPCKGHQRFWQPPEDIMEPKHVLIDFDECECGDYRRDHDLATGRCIMPDNMAHGMQPCLAFKLTRAAVEIPEPFRSR